MVIKKDKYGKMREFVEVVCKQCNKTFEKTKNSIKKETYCSNLCYHEATTSKKCEIECLLCKKIFVRPVYRVKDFNFCSRECKDKSQRIENDIQEIWPSHYGTSKNGISNYREFALRNKKNECERCGWCLHQNILQIHHKDRNRENNTLDNLEVLCPNCHAVEHWLKEGNLEG